MVYEKKKVIIADNVVGFQDLKVLSAQKEVSEEKNLSSDLMNKI